MKIVIGLSRPFHLVHLARELSELGHEVIVIGYMPKWKMKNYNLGKAKYFSLFLICLPFSIFALQRSNGYIQRQFTYLIMPIVDFLIALFMPACDVFIGLSGVNTQSFIKAKRRFNAITICDRGSAHVLEQAMLCANDRDKFPIPKKYIERELFGYENADYITVPSIFSYNSFLKHGIIENKIFLNNYGVNLTRFKNKKINVLSATNKKVKILFVGGWSFQKGCDVFEGVLESSENIFVTHIGSRVDLDFPIHKNFTSLGHVDNSQLPSYYSQFDILVLPSRQDGFGMVLLEALVSGLSIIASSNTGANDINKVLGNKSFIQVIDNVNITNIINAVGKLVKNNSFPNLTESEIAYFTWHAYAMRYDSFLKSIT